ncbi:hypothetical protein [Streptomyces sp. NPDC059171]|uniref:hypothetical protein n=1 Tax=Streptomyces sp. NPDC059171 TaxID=3346755 RepID=UPI0036B4EBD6
MTESATITDLRRELAKAHDALMDVEVHLARHAEMNAALHCSERVMYSPLHAKVDVAIHGIKHALARTEHVTDQDRDGGWDALVWDLDRCQHGRHQGDACGPADDCNGTSAGNPHLRPGAVIGYGMRRDPIVMPDRDHKHDPNAWRPQGKKRTAPAA